MRTKFGVRFGLVVELNPWIEFHWVRLSLNFKLSMYYARKPGVINSRPSLSSDCKTVRAIARNGYMISCTLIDSHKTKTLPRPQKDYDQEK